MSCESDLLLWDGSRGSGWILKVRMQKGLIDAYEGASIAINGVCLTVLEWPVKDGVVSFGVAPETIKLTNLVRLTALSSAHPAACQDTALDKSLPPPPDDCICRATWKQVTRSMWSALRKLTGGTVGTTFRFAFHDSLS